MLSDFLWSQLNHIHVPDLNSTDSFRCQTLEKNYVIVITKCSQRVFAREKVKGKESGFKGRGR